MIYLPKNILNASPKLLSFKYLSRYNLSAMYLSTAFGLKLLTVSLSDLSMKFYLMSQIIFM